MSLKDDTLKSLLELEKEAILHIEEFLKNEYKAITKALGFEKMGKYIEDFENREVYKSYLQHCSTIFIRYVEEIESSQALLGGEVMPPLSSKFYWDKIEKSSKNNSNSATSDPDETNVSEPDTDEICGEETKVGVMSTYEVECNWYIRPDGDTEPSGDAEPNGDVELGFSKDIKITINDVGSGYFTHVLNIIAKAFGDELDESTLSNHILNTLDLHTDSAEITKITVSADGSIKVTITCTNSAHQKEVFELNDGIGTKRTTYFKDLWKLLDLTHNSTRKLLPYLLAAYTCNEPRNQLIRRDTTGWKMIFNTEEADSNNIEDITYDDAEKSFTRRNDQITKLRNH